MNGREPIDLQAPNQGTIVRAMNKKRLNGIREAAAPQPLDEPPGHVA